MSAVDSTVEALQLLPPVLVLLVAVVLVAGETGTIFGLFFPVEITLLTVGFLAYVGELPLVPVFLLMIVAAALGDALALRSGRRYGERVRASRLGTWVGPERWARADRILHRLGGRSAFVARWAPFVRTVLPRLAGSAGMSYRTFAPWNYAGVVTAVGSSVVLGFLAGASYQRVAEALGRATTAVLMLAVVVVAIVLAGRWLGRHPDPVRTLAARLAAPRPFRWANQRYGRGAGRLAARIGTGPVLVAHIAAGVVLLFGFGILLSWLVQVVVGHSGLSAVDTVVAGWFAERRAGPVTGAAEAVAAVLRASTLSAVVAVVAVALAARTRLWRGDLVEVLGTAGAFVPLVVLAVVAELTGGHAAAAGWRSTQIAVATAALCTLAWLLARRVRWPAAVAAWTLAAVGIVLLVAARLYLGRDTTSATVTAVLLGALWPVVLMVAWATRTRAVEVSRIRHQELQ